MRKISAICLTLILTAAANASVITILNPSFELPTLNNNSASTSVPDWNVAFGGAFNPPTSAFPGEAVEGDNVAYGNTGGEFSQVLSDTLQVGDYELTVWLGDSLNNPFINYSVELHAGGTLLASDSGTVTPPNGDFVQTSVQFTALASDPNLGELLEVRLTSAGVRTHFDDVRLTFVPEPTSCTILCSLLLCLPLVRRYW